MPPCLFDRRKHAVFDDTKKLITQEFVRQLYLDYERVPKSEPPTFTFRWGERAWKEVSLRGVLDLASKVSIQGGFAHSVEESVD